VSNVWLTCWHKNRYLLVFNVGETMTKVVMNLFHIDASNSGKVILEKLNVVISLTSALFCLCKLINKYEQTVTPECTNTLFNVLLWLKREARGP